MKPQQFLGLEGAKTLYTQRYQLTLRAVSDVVETQGMGLVLGMPGVGKTYSVAAACDREEIEVRWFDFPGRTSPKAITKGLLETIGGVPQQGTRVQLEERLIALLSERPRLIVLDEAQRLYADSVEDLRRLWDNDETQFALLLVGGHNCRQVISRFPAIISRLHRQVEFKPLSQDEVLEHIPNFHSLYERADPGLLTYIDEEFGAGILRNWANFTRTALQIAAANALRAMDRHVADAAFTLLGDSLTQAA